MTDDTCGHCRRPIVTASRGWAADGTVLCHTGTLPPDADPPDCYRLATIYGHATDGSCCYSAEDRLANFYDHVDTSTLDSEEVEIEPSANPRSSQVVSFAREDMRELRRVAGEHGMPVGDLIRRWVLERLRPNPQPKVMITMSPASQGPGPGISPAALAAALEHGRRQGRYEMGG